MTNTMHRTISCWAVAFLVLTGCRTRHIFDHDSAHNFTSKDQPVELGLAGGTFGLFNSVGFVKHSAGTCSAVRIHERYLITSAHCGGAPHTFSIGDMSIPDYFGAEAIGSGWPSDGEPGDIPTDILVLRLSPKNGSVYPPGAPLGLMQTDPSSSATSTFRGYGWSPSTSLDSEWGAQRFGPFTYWGKYIGAHVWSNTALRAEDGDSGGPFIIGNDIASILSRAEGGQDPYVHAAPVPDNFFNISRVVMQDNTTCLAQTYQSTQLSYNNGNYTGTGNVKFQFAINDLLPIGLGTNGKTKIRFQIEFESNYRGRTYRHISSHETAANTFLSYPLTSYTFPISLPYNNEDLVDRGSIIVRVGLVYTRVSPVDGVLQESRICESAAAVNFSL